MSRLTVRVNVEVESCPKCGRARRTTDRSCVQCGLAVGRMLGFTHPANASVSPVLVAAWQAVVADWSSAPRHDEVLRLAHQHDAWAWAARKYRGRVRENPTDRIAARGLERLERGLAVGMVRVADPKVARPYRAALRMLIVMLLVLGVGVVYTTFIYRNHEPVETGY